MQRELLLLIITAMIAGAIGFGIAVYAVPPEEAMQFRALINAGLGVSSETARSNILSPTEGGGERPAPTANEPATVTSPPPSASVSEGEPRLIGKTLKKAREIVEAQKEPCPTTPRRKKIDNEFGPGTGVDGSV